MSAAYHGGFARCGRSCEQMRTVVVSQETCYASVMRSILVVAVLGLSACGARGASGPAWPKTAASDTDGGESLAPRQPAAIAVAAAAGADDDDDIKVVATPTATTPATPAATPAAATPSAAMPPDDSITIDEIVIEIDD
jgi:hypothetical protein